MTLGELPHQRVARILGLDLLDGVGVRLMELGLVPGTRVKVLRQAPLGDPIQVNVAGARLALRRDVANRVSVEPV